MMEGVAESVPGEEGHQGDREVGDDGQEKVDEREK